MAKTDPLGLDDRKLPIELDPQLYGFSDKDLDRECVLAKLLLMTRLRNGHIRIHATWQTDCLFIAATGVHGA